MTVGSQRMRAYGLTQEWRVEGTCNEKSEDCDHFGEHGDWFCDVICESREEAEALPIAKSPDARIVSRWVSPWVGLP